MAKVITIVLLCCLLAGCGWLGGKTPNPLSDNSLNDKTTLSPTETSQEKAFTGLRWLIYAGAGLAAIGFGLLFVPIDAVKNWAFGGMASGGLLTFIAITLNQHYVLISWIGLGLGLACIGLLGWMLWKNKAKLQTVGRALIDVVIGNDEVKKILPSGLRKQIYGAPGDHSDKGLIGDIQSPATEKLVAEIRNGG